MNTLRSGIGKKSMQKGRRAELRISNALSLWWTGGKDSKAFRRTPLSGGWLSHATDGDIIPITPEAELFKYVVEIKDRKEIDDFDFAEILINEKCSILQWWKTLNETIQNNPHRHAGKQRLLIVHKKHKDYCVVGIPEMTFLEERTGKFPYMKIWTPFSETLIVFSLGSLLDADPEALKTGFLDVKPNG
jgi:hypothetical protein